MPQSEKSGAAGRFTVLAGPASGAGNSSGQRDDLSDFGNVDPALFELFEQITRWLQCGEGVDEEKLIVEHPAWEHEIRNLLPALREMARASQLDKKQHAASPDENRDQDGRQIVGEFRIVREVGRGGMGIVYEAEQPALARRVALKVLPSAAALDPRAIQRFQLEAQVAGWLQHPRIVPVHAVGVVGEIPYFAMQFIDGGSLGAVIAELRLLVEPGAAHGAGPPNGDSPSALARGLLSGHFEPTARDPANHRPQDADASGSDKPVTRTPRSVQCLAYCRTVARLGIQAAGALGYAHEQGVVHRDVKPANLLLDRRGDLWVADFGMADVQGDAGLTLSGDLPGTLRYMSPEQATGQRARVDRRTDIYSLGATLYELLTLHPAVTGTDKAEIIRRIAEEEPMPIRRLNPAVPVDLATIVTKAISKEPANRYDTALALVDDLERFLDGRPIAARPVGPLARSWRWCRRKPVQASLAVALVVALSGGFAGVTWNWREAVRQKQVAEQQKALLASSQSRAEVSEKQAILHAAKADAINDFLLNKLLRQASPENNSAARHVTLLEVLDQAAAEVGSSFRAQPEVEAAVRLAIGHTYHDLGDYKKSEMHYQAAYQILKDRADDSGLKRLEAMMSLGHSLEHLSRLAEAQALLEAASEQIRRTLGPTHDLDLEATGYLASLRRHQGRAADAEALQRELEQRTRVVHGPKHPATLRATSNLGVFLQNQKKYAEAERLLRECLVLSREIRGPQHAATVGVMNSLGGVLAALGRVEEADALYRQTLELSRQVFGPEHPRTLLTMRAVGTVLTTVNKWDEAVTLLRSCLEAQRRVLGVNDYETLHTAEHLDAAIKQRAAQNKARPSSTPNASRE